MTKLFDDTNCIFVSSPCFKLHPKDERFLFSTTINQDQFTTKRLSFLNLLKANMKTRMAFNTHFRQFRQQNMYISSKGHFICQFQRVVLIQDVFFLRLIFTCNTITTSLHILFLDRSIRQVILENKYLLVHRYRLVARKPETTERSKEKHQSSQTGSIGNYSQPGRE